jgi:DegV family protein with EDD domain
LLTFIDLFANIVYLLAPLSVTILRYNVGTSAQRGSDVGKVVVVTDSTATVPSDLAQALDIRIVPVLLVLGNQTFRDGVDITPGDVYRWLRTSKQIPTTAAPSIGDFVRIYASAAQEASGVVSIHMSPDLSATYNVALMASQLVDGAPIRVVNCHTAAMGQGFATLEAARVASAGATLDEVVSRLEEVAAKVNLFLTLDTFEYLHRGGRIGRAAALVGTLLQIKPLLCLDDGHVGALAKPRTRPKAIRLLVRRMAEQVGDRPLHAAVFHADAPAEAEDLRQRLADQFDCVELYVTEFTPVMGAHTGPGLLGVAFYGE